MLEILKKEGNAFLELEGIFLIGNYTKNYLSHPDKDVVFFENTSNEGDSRTRLRLFELIKNLEISEIPEDVQFHIMQVYSYDPIPEPVDRLPFPFDIITIGNNNKGSYFVRFSTFNQHNSEEWRIKWASDFYFNSLRQVDLGPDILVFEQGETDLAEVLVQINLPKIGSVGASVDVAIQELEKVVNKVEVKLSGLEDLFDAIEVWHKNIENKSEKFWQTLLSKYSWILSQSFNSPLVLFEKEAFLGGKSISNVRGRIVDFVLRNKLTQNVALIEIKTPKTKIVGKKYRSQYAISEDTTGAIAQLLDYKEQLLKDFYSIKANTESSFTVFNPKLLLIIGSFRNMAPDEKNTFELFRSDLKSVEIITFDELFEKIFMLIELIGKKTENENLIPKWLP